MYDLGSLLGACEKINIFKKKKKRLIIEGKEVNEGKVGREFTLVQVHCLSKCQ